MTGTRVSPRRRPGRPRGGQALADREALLDAAEGLIARDGPEVTMEAIAAAAGVTKPILYRGIGDREALVAALAERFVDRINAVVEAAVVGASGPHEALRRFASAYLGAVDTERNLYTFITSSPTGGRGDQALHLADRSVLQMAAQLGAQRQAQGLDPAAATPWAYAIVGMMHIVTLWWMRDATISREDLAEHLADLLWAGLRGEAPPIVP